MTSFMAITHSLLGVATLAVSPFMKSEGYPVVIVAGLTLLFHGLRYCYVVSDEYQAKIEDTINAK